MMNTLCTEDHCASSPAMLTVSGYGLCELHADALTVECARCDEREFDEEMGFTEGGDGPFCEPCLERAQWRENLEYRDEGERDNDDDE